MARDPATEPRRSCIVFMMGGGPADEEAQRALDYYWNRIVDDGADLEFNRHLRAWRRYPSIKLMPWCTEGIIAEHIAAHITDTVTVARIMALAIPAYSDMALLLPTTVIPLPTMRMRPILTARIPHLVGRSGVGCRDADSMQLIEPP